MDLVIDCAMTDWKWHAVVQLALHEEEHLVHACHAVWEKLTALLVLCNTRLPGSEYGHDMMQKVVGKLRRKLLVG